MATKHRQRADQVSNKPLPHVPEGIDPKVKKYLEDLVRELRLKQDVVVGVQDNGSDQPLRAVLNFIGTSVTDDLTSDRTSISIGGGAGAAPVNATYLCVALNGVLTNERRFVAGDGLVATDAGANNTYTVDFVALANSHLIVGADSVDWSGVTVQRAGSTVGTRRGINLIEGGGLGIAESDNAGSDRVDVTLVSQWVRPFLTMGG